MSNYKNAIGETTKGYEATSSGQEFKSMVTNTVSMRSSMLSNTTSIQAKPSTPEM